MSRLVWTCAVLVLIGTSGCSVLDFLTGGAQNSDQYHLAKVGKNSVWTVPPNGGP